MLLFCTLHYFKIICYIVQIIVPAALELLKDLDKSNTTAAFWADHKWNTEWQKILLASTHLFHLLALHHRNDST